MREAGRRGKQQLSPYGRGTVSARAPPAARPRVKQAIIVGRRRANLARPFFLCYVVLERTRNGSHRERRMAAAALTPRVRTIVICDDVSSSMTEEGVF